MTKKLVAVTNIQHDGEFYEAESTLDPAKFKKEQLQALYDNGAVKVVDDDKMEPETPTPETEGPPPEEQPEA